MAEAEAIANAIKELDEVLRHSSIKPSELWKKQTGLASRIYNMSDTDMPSPMKYYLYGKLFNLGDYYSEISEEYLLYAMQTDYFRDISDLWLQLGVCMLKKNDYVEACRYFKRAFVTQDADIQRISFLESMALRKCVKSSKSISHMMSLLGQSIESASQAFELSKDGKSLGLWGDAYYTKFYATGGQRYGDFGIQSYGYLRKAWRLYKFALKWGDYESKSDICFRYAEVCMSLQKYERALQHLTQAMQMDPSMMTHAKHRIAVVVSLLDTVKQNIQDITTKPFCCEDIDPANYSLDDFDVRNVIDMDYGWNSDSLILGVVRYVISSSYYLVSDYQTCFVLAVIGMPCHTHTDAHAIEKHSVLLIRQPWYKSIKFTWEKEEYDFKIVSVASIGQLRPMETCERTCPA